MGADDNRSVDWKAALAISLAAILWAHTAPAGERETSRELVLRSLGHISRAEINAVAPLFADGSLQETTLDQFVGAIGVMGLGDSVESQLVTENSQQTPDGVVIDTVVYHMSGPNSALLAVGQVEHNDGELKLVGLSFNPAPQELSELFPFVLVGLSYVHYYMLIALVCVPALMAYATVQCLRRESGVGWAWIPLILIGIGRATAVWVPGPPDERLFSFVPATITMLGVQLVKVPVFEPWQVSVSVPLGAIAYLWWSGRRQPTQVESGVQPTQTASHLSG